MFEQRIHYTAILLAVFTASSCKSEADQVRRKPAEISESLGAQDQSPVSVAAGLTDKDIEMTPEEKDQTFSDFEEQAADVLCNLTAARPRLAAARAAFQAWLQAKITPEQYAAYTQNVTENRQTLRDIIFAAHPELKAHLNAAKEVLPAPAPGSDGLNLAEAPGQHLVDEVITANGTHYRQYAGSGSRGYFTGSATTVTHPSGVAAGRISGSAWDGRAGGITAVRVPGKSAAFSTHLLIPGVGFCLGYGYKTSSNSVAGKAQSSGGACIDANGKVYSF